jgi:hypothetical protein
MTPRSQLLRDFSHRPLALAGQRDRTLAELLRIWPWHEHHPSGGVRHHLIGWSTKAGESIDSLTSTPLSGVGERLCEYRLTADALVVEAGVGNGAGI